MSTGKSCKGLRNVRAQVWMTDKEGNIVTRGTKRHEIFRRTETTGVIINDGREVRKKDGKWIYHPR
jgi:hypothetical protein